VRSSHAIAIALLAIPAPLHADRSSFSATASGDVAATLDTNENDILLTLRPGVLFAYDAPRMIHELDLQAEVIELARTSDQPLFSIRGGWRSSFTTGKGSSLLTQVSGSNGRLTALAARSSPDQTVTQVTPLGAVDTQQGDASEFFSWGVGRDFRMSQSLFGRASRTDDGAMTITTSAELGVGLGIERGFRSNSLSLEVGVSVLRLELDAPAGMAGRLDRQLDPRARA
jgi:hypothetical protein